MTEELIKKLRKAAIELEEFKLKAALGKAEARDHFESAKRNFRLTMHKARLGLSKVRNAAGSTITELRTSLDELRVQLALGKAESREAFQAQAVKIERILNKLEKIIRKNKLADKQLTQLAVEIKKFRIKMDILKLRYELKKIDVSRDFEQFKKDFSAKLERSKEKLDTQPKGKVKWEHFNMEINKAYKHFKKAFVNS